MSAFIDLTGQRFSRLVVVSLHSKDGSAKWNCICDCGSTKVVQTSSLRRGATKSCGCLQKERASSANKTHGMRRHPMYNTWTGIKKRCYNENNPSYNNYGGRGITVCERWLESFDNFLEDMFPTWKEGLSLDRIDVNGNYEPSNCQWANDIEQANNKRETRYIGDKTLRDYCKERGLKVRSMREKINTGMTPEEAESSLPNRWFVGDIPLVEYCKENNLKYDTVVRRIARMGWSIEDAITIPIISRPRKIN